MPVLQIGERNQNVYGCNNFVESVTLHKIKVLD